MKGKPGPVQLTICPTGDCPTGESTAREILEPFRRYDCAHYETCLNLTAALNWRSFSCAGCSGRVDETLVWRARQAQRKDHIAGKLCKIPSLEAIEQEDTLELPRGIINED